MPLSRRAKVSLVVIAIAVGVGLALGLSSSSSSSGSKEEEDPNSVEVINPKRDAPGTAVPTTTPVPTTVSPTFLPSASPTEPPTLAPSVPPTQRPSLRPSAHPSQSPTKNPTPAPTPVPTPQPTLVPPGYTFRLKLYWQKGYFWQEETFERKWCLECVKCTPLTTSAFGEGCNDKRGSTCERGDQMWLQNCDKRTRTMAKFRIHPDSRTGRGDMFQVVQTNLCLERSGTSFIVLERCNASNERQRWEGFLPRQEPFEWNPVEGSKTSRCVTQHHHPKATEVIYCSDCQLAHRWQTGFWEAY